MMYGMSVDRLRMQTECSSVLHVAMKVGAAVCIAYVNDLCVVGHVGQQCDELFFRHGLFLLWGRGFFFGFVRLLL